MIDKPKILQRKDLGDFSISFRDDGIVQVDIIPNIEINVDHIKTGVENLKEMGKGKKFPVLFIAGNYSVPNEEARYFRADAKNDPYSLSDAYVINSISQKLVGNFYLIVNKPTRPTKLFTEVNEAVEWLKTFI